MIIMRLARWGSDAVYGYIKDAPLEQLTVEYKAAIDRESAKDLGPAGFSATALVGRIDELQAAVKSLKVKPAIDEMLSEARVDAALEERSLALEAMCQPLELVQNLVTKAVHKIIMGDVSLPSDMWRTKCGWLFGRKAHQRLKEIPEDHPWTGVCERCLPDARAALREAAFWSAEFVEGAFDDGV